jgi:hypothetical protein
MRPVRRAYQTTGNPSPPEESSCHPVRGLEQSSIGRVPTKGRRSRSPREGSSPFQASSRRVGRRWALGRQTEEPPTVSREGCRVPLSFPPFLDTRRARGFAPPAASFASYSSALSLHRPSPSRLSPRRDRQAPSRPSAAHGSGRSPDPAPDHCSRHGRVADGSIPRHAPELLFAQASSCRRRCHRASKWPPGRTWALSPHWTRGTDFSRS